MIWCSMVRGNQGVEIGIFFDSSNKSETVSPTLQLLKHVAFEVISFRDESLQYSTAAIVAILEIHSLRLKPEFVVARRFWLCLNSLFFCVFLIAFLVS